MGESRTGKKGWSLEPMLSEDEDRISPGPRGELESEDAEEVELGEWLRSSLAWLLVELWDGVVEHRTGARTVRKLESCVP